MAAPFALFGRRAPKEPRDYCVIRWWAVENGAGARIWRGPRSDDRGGGWDLGPPTRDAWTDAG